MRTGGRGRKSQAFPFRRCFHCGRILFAHGKREIMRCTLSGLIYQDYRNLWDIVLNVHALALCGAALEGLGLQKSQK